MNKNAAPIPDKKLTDREIFYHKIHEEYYGGFSIISVKIKVAGPLDIQLIKQACRYLWESSPLLRARIESGVIAPSFVYDVPVRDIPVHSVFELGKTDIRQFLEKEADTSFNSSRNLWRVLLITDKSEFDRHYLILSIHRSMGEADFALQCAQEILHSCSKILAGGKDNPSGTRIPRVGDHLDGFDELSASTQHDETVEGIIEFSVNAPISRRHTHVRNFKFSPDKFKALYSKCLDLKISLPGILGAVLITAMRKNFSVETIGIEVSSFTNGPLSSQGYFTFHIGEADISSDIWVNAQNCDRTMSGIPGSRVNGHIQADLISAIRDLKHFPARCAMEIVSSLEAPRPLSIDDIAIVHGNKCATEAVYLSAVIMQEALSLTYACAYPLMDDGRSDRFVRDLTHLLDRAIKNSRS